MKMEVPIKKLILIAYQKQPLIIFNYNSSGQIYIGRPRKLRHEQAYSPKYVKMMVINFF